MRSATPGARALPPVTLPIPDDHRLPADLLTVALGLTLWVGTGSMLLTIVDGLGEQPARRLAVGAALVGATALALVRRDAVTAALQRRPALVVLVAAAQIAGAGIDGVVGGAFVAFSLTSIGLAVVVARARTVWACVLVLEAGYLAALAAQGHTVAQLADEGQLGGVIGAAAGFPVAAALFLVLRRRFVRFLAGVDETVLEIRADRRGFTPALGRALRDEPPLTLPVPAVNLTPAERRVVEALAGGLTPKQIAYAWGVKISTIRTHIKHAKVKTGARTLPELATFPTRPDWEPAGEHDG